MVMSYHETWQYDLRQLIDYPMKIIFDSSPSKKLVSDFLLSYSDLAEIYFSKFSLYGTPMNILADFYIQHETRMFEKCISTIQTNSNLKRKMSFHTFKTKVEQRIKSEELEDAKKLFEQSIACHNYGEHIFEAFSIICSTSNINNIMFFLRSEIWNIEKNDGKEMAGLVYWKCVQIMKMTKHIRSEELIYILFRNDIYMFFKYYRDFAMLALALHYCEYGEEDFEKEIRIARIGVSDNSFLTDEEKEKITKQSINALFNEEADVEYVSSEMTHCPKCNGELAQAKMNIAIGLQNMRFVGYYLANVHVCLSCASAFVFPNEYNHLRERVIDTRAGGQTSAFNAAQHDNTYKTLPTGNLLLFDVIDNASDSCFGYSDNNIMCLNKKSFLAKLGYSTALWGFERESILKKATLEYGKRAVVDHLLFLIRTRKGQQDGANRYANAIDVWESDIEYVRKL